MAGPVDVEGANQLARALRRIGDRDLKAGLQAANLKAAQVVVAKALPNVPVGKTGRLKASTRAMGSVRGGVARSGTTRVAYAAALHWGRKVGNVGRPPGNHPGPNPIPRRPFLWDAAKTSTAQVDAVYVAEVKSVIRRAGMEVR